MSGYTRGVQSGYTRGYADGIAVLDDAAALLAQMKPSQSVGLRQREISYTTPSRTPEENRARAAQSWGLPPPKAAARGPATDSVKAAEPRASQSELPVAELSLDDWT